jgi:hypothetical protein
MFLLAPPIKKYCIRTEKRVGGWKKEGERERER